MIFGNAATASNLQKDKGFTQAILEDANILVAEWEMKWGAIERRRESPDYTSADWLVDFARQNGLRMRGHAMIWHLNMPPWLDDALLGSDGRAIVARHIERIAGRYSGRLAHWDVVNEAIEPKDGRSDGMRNTPFLRALGTEYIAEAFHVARQNVPEASLYYNDYGVDYDNAEQQARRTALLRLLERLKRAGAPIDAVGIQGHLWAEGPRFSQRVFSDFLRSVSDLGLKILITEFDVSDRNVTGSVAERDLAVAAHGKSYLDAAFANPNVLGVVAWGVSDKYTWRNDRRTGARLDGLPNRALPRDSDMVKKPLWHAIASAFEAATERAQ